MDRSQKKKAQQLIKQAAELGKELNALNRQVQKQEFTQGQRHLEFVNKSFKEFFGSMKRLYFVVK